MGATPRRSDAMSRLSRAERRLDDLERGPSLVTLQRLIDERLETVQEATQAAIEAAIAELPVIVSEAVEEENWQATDGGTIAQISLSRPAGKTRATILAQINGFYQANLNVPRSDTPAFHIRIGAQESTPQVRAPDNNDTFHIVGSFTRELNANANVGISVRTRTGDELSPAYPTNRMYLGVIAIFE